MELQSEITASLRAVDQSILCRGRTSRTIAVSPTHKKMNSAFSATPRGVAQTGCPLAFFGELLRLAAGVHQSANLMTGAQ